LAYVHNVLPTLFAGDSHMASVGAFSTRTTSGKDLNVRFDQRFMVSAVSSPMGVTPADSDLKNVLSKVSLTEFGLPSTTPDTQASLLPVFPATDGT
jgi:hypothetical protein